MNILSNLRKVARKTIDSFYQKKLPDKKTVGGPNDFWTILTDRFSSKIVYSGGVGKDIGFELHLIEKYGCEVFCFDPSPTGIHTIESLIHQPSRLHFYPIGLSNLEGEEIEFSTPLDPSEGSFTLAKSREGQHATTLFKCKKISSLMNEFGHAHLDILKIDIEGFEYGVIEDIFENNLSISQICVEFHHFFDNIPFMQTKKAIKTLKKLGYDLVHKTGSDYLFVKI